MLTWLVCHNCGWELLGNAAASGCLECDKPDIHIHSNRDGELPKRLPRHRTTCSDQNALRDDGPYVGAESCSCRQPYFRMIDVPDTSRKGDDPDGA